MNKQEALAVMREFYEANKESATITCISLDSSQVSHIFTGGYQIRMKTDLDSYSKENLKAIAKKYNLSINEMNGHVIISSA